jgi:hypothetical protein
LLNRDLGQAHLSRRASLITNLLKTLYQMHLTLGKNPLGWPKYSNNQGAARQKTGENEGFKVWHESCQEPN